MTATSVIPLLGIVTNVALFLYLAGRIDKLTDAVYALADRITRLGDRITHLLEGVARK